MKTRVIALFALILFALGAAPLWAMNVEGTYEIYQDSNLIGVEKFDVKFKSDGSILTSSSGTLKEDETNSQSLTELQYRKTGEIKDYQREIYINRVPMKLAAINQGAKLLIQVNTGPKQTERKVAIHRKTIVLEVGTFHHYNVLLAKFRANSSATQTFWAVAPSEFREFKVTVNKMKTEAVKMQEGYFDGTKYFINQGNVGVIAWMDERNKIFKMKIPAQGLDIGLKGYKGKRSEKATEGILRVVKFERQKVIFRSLDGTDMAGTISRPSKLMGKLPAILFSSTSGPQDREGTSKVSGIDTHTHEILDRLTHEGYLVLRYDDRGVGESGGEYSQNALSMQEKEILGAIKYLKSRPDVDTSRLCLIGHGEGANAVLQAIVGRSDLKAVVLLAPSSIALTQLAIRQVKTRLAAEGNTDPEAYKRFPVYRMIDKSRESTDRFTVVGERPVYLDIFREWDNMDPISDIQKVPAAILHMQGQNDQQFFQDLAAGLKNAPKKGKYTFKMFEGLDHFFIKSSGDIGEYADPARKIDKEFLDYLVNWLGANL